MTKDEVKNLFAGFSEYTIMVIGDVMIDSYLWGKVERISPEAPVPVVLGLQRENRLGGAANVALNLQALGALPVLVSVIGEDANTQNFFQLLEKSNLPSNGILTNQNRKTTIKTRIIAAHQHLLRIDEETENNLDKHTQIQFIDHITELLKEKKFHAIIFEDYDKGVITEEVIEKVVQLAKEIGIPTLVDPKKRNFMFYRDVTLFKPNFKELTEGLKLEIGKGDLPAIHEASMKLRKLLNIQYSLITLSEHGIFINKENSYLSIPAEVRDIADVSGAGDTVISIACVCLVSGLSPEHLATICNLGGGLVCERVGVVPIDKIHLEKEVLRYFST